MLIGAHITINSTNSAADQAFFRDVLKLPHVDAGEGFLIFGVSSAEVAVHRGDHNDVHEFYVMCDDVEGFIAELRERNIASSPVQDQGWGLLTRITLPDGGKMASMSRATPVQNPRAQARRGRRCGDPGRRRGGRAQSDARSLGS